MPRLAILFAILTLLTPGWCYPNQTQTATTTEPAKAQLLPSPEMQRLFDAFTGEWAVSESFEISPSRHGQTRQGTASFRAGPGFSLIEDYQSNGSAGKLNFLAVLWWDQSAKSYRLLTCANNDGCEVRGTAK